MTPLPTADACASDMACGGVVAEVDYVLTYAV